MPVIRVLPHATLCPQGAEFEAEAGVSVCEALLEHDIAKRRPAYRSYAARTSAFIPWPPRRGARP